MNAAAGSRADAMLQRLRGIVPVLTIDDPDRAAPLARTLVEAGLPVLEVTLRTPCALDAIARMREVPGAIVGAGTVLSAADLVAVERAGAAFAISPGATPLLYEAACDCALPFLPGIATPGELMQGIERGYARFKFFPAEAAGGTRMLAGLSGPFPGVAFCPTGGIDAAKASAYLALPNVFAIGGSWMVPGRLVEAARWAEIGALAAQAAALAAAPAP